MDGVQCKKCRYLLKGKDGYNWCPNKIDDPDIDLIRDCKWYAVKTNADKVRQMSDEELADYLDGVCHDLWQMFVADPQKMWLDWLKEEVKNNG